jgi:hypothetical protein
MVENNKNYAFFIQHGINNFLVQSTILLYRVGKKYTGWNNKKV